MFDSLQSKTLATPLLAKT